MTVSCLFTLLSITLMFLGTVHYSSKLWFTLDIDLSEQKIFFMYMSTQQHGSSNNN